MQHILKDLGFKPFLYQKNYTRFQNNKTRNPELCSLEEVIRSEKYSVIGWKNIFCMSNVCVNARVCVEVCAPFCHFGTIWAIFPILFFLNFRFYPIFSIFRKFDDDKDFSYDIHVRQTFNLTPF